MIKLEMIESDIIRAMKNTKYSPLHYLSSRFFKKDIRDIEIDNDCIVLWDEDTDDYISYRYCTEDIEKIIPFIDEWQDFIDHKTHDDFQLPPIIFCVEENK